MFYVFLNILKDMSLCFIPFNNLGKNHESFGFIWSRGGAHQELILCVPWQQKANSEHWIPESQSGISDFRRIDVEAIDLHNDMFNENVKN